MLYIRRETMVIYFMIFWKIDLGFTQVINDRLLVFSCIFCISVISNAKWDCMTIVMEMCMVSCIQCDIWFVLTHALSIPTLRPRQNGHHFPYDIFKHIFLNENVGFVFLQILLIFPYSPIHNNPVLFQIMAWCRLGDKPLFAPKMP